MCNLSSESQGRQQRKAWTNRRRRFGENTDLFQTFYIVYCAFSTLLCQQNRQTQVPLQVLNRQRRHEDRLRGTIFVTRYTFLCFFLIFLLDSVSQYLSRLLYSGCIQSFLVIQPMSNDRAKLFRTCNGIFRCM